MEEDKEEVTYHQKIKGEYLREPVPSCESVNISLKVVTSILRVVGDHEPVLLMVSCCTRQHEESSFSLV